MSATKPGSNGMYSEQARLRFQCAELRNNLLKKPLGPEAVANTEAELREYYARLKEVNAKLLELKRRQLRA